MGDREVDQQLVERAQRGDKRAFELLVLKYQRKLGRLLSRFVRDPAEVEDVTQEAFIKAYRALPSFRGDSAFYTWLYRIGDQHREELPGRAGPPGADDDRVRQRGSGRFRGRRAAAGHEHARERAARQADRGDGEPRDGSAARGPAHGDHAARDRGPELRGNRERDELPDRHGALADLPARGRRSRPSCGRCWAPTRTGDGDERGHFAPDGRRTATTTRPSASCAQMQAAEALATWACYHLIGDALRGEPARCARLLAALRRAARGRADGARARRRGAGAPAADLAWAAAATVAAVARRSAGSALVAGRMRRHRHRQGARGRHGRAGAGAHAGAAAGLPARAPGVLAADRDPGRRALPARRAPGHAGDAEQ